MSDLEPIKTEISVEPESEPLTVALAKTHLRVTVDAEDAYITGLIVLARQKVENDTGRCLMSQTWLQYFDKFPSGDELKLAYAPVQSITSITYKDSAGDTSTQTASEYDLDAKEVPPLIRLGYNEVWPSDVLYPTNPITVTFVAGYTSISNIPAALIHAMKLLIGHWYENREPLAPVKLMTVPMGYDNLIASHRTGWF